MTKTKRPNKDAGRLQGKHIALATCIALAGTGIPAIALASNDSTLDDLTSVNVTAVSQGTLSSNENVRWALGTNGGLAISGKGSLSADDALYDIANQVTSIYIAKDISSIGAETFSFFGNLQAVEFEEGSILDNIGAYSFANCSNLQTICFPSSLRFIETAAFQDCRSLTTLSCDVNTSGLEKIGPSAFANCTSLAEFALPKTLKSIENYAFDGCESLKRIEIPASVTTVGESAFENCSSLKDILVEDPAKTKVDQYAFAGNTTAKPASIKITKAKVGKKCATITWSKVAKASSYKLCYKKKGARKYKAKVLTRTTAKLKSLAKGKRYKLYVIAKAGDNVICKSKVKTTAKIR